MRGININDPVSCILPQSARNDEPINMPVTVFTVSSYNGVNTVSVTLSAHRNFHGGNEKEEDNVSKTFKTGKSVWKLSV